MPQKIELYGVIGFDWPGYAVSAHTIISAIKAIEDSGDDDQDIDLHINSGGGYVQDANAIFNRLRQHAREFGGTITVYIDALAASAATIIAGAGDHVVMPDNGTFMIHRPWGIALGEADDMRKYADRLEAIENQMVRAYLRRASNVDEEELRALIAEETWMDAEQALDLGFVDEVVNGDEEVEDDAAAAIAQYVEVCDSARAEEHEQSSGDLPLPLPEYSRSPRWVRIAAMKRPEAAPSRANQSPELDTMPKPKNHPRPRTRAEDDEEEVVDIDEEEEAMEEEEASSEEAVDLVLARDRKRGKTIRALCRKHGVSEDYAEELCEQGLSVTKAKAKILDRLAQGSSQASGVRIEQDFADKRADGVRSALLIRANILSSEEVRDELGSNPYIGMSLTQLCYEFDEKRGKGDTANDVITRVLNAGRAQPAGRVRADGMGITHTTGDFTSILSNVAHLSMLRGWDTAPATWREWCNIGTLSDFRPATRAGLNHFGELPVLPEGGEYKGTQLDDRGVTNQLVTYGGKFGITRQAIRNDDVRSFTTIPQGMGAAAMRTLSGVVYALLFENPTIESAQLFSVGHNTTHSIDIDSDGLATLTAAMMTQKAPALPDGTNHDAVLNMSPSILLVPAALRHTAKVLLEAAFISDGTGTTSNVNDPLKLVTEGRLDANSATTIYMIADPAQYDTFEVAFLDGIQTPYLERIPTFDVDGVMHKVRIDAGVAALDFRGFQRGT